MKKHQKLLSLLLSAVMAVSMLPGTGLEALAASRTYLKDGSYTKSAQVIPVEYEEDGETYTDFDQYSLEVTVTVSGEKITEITASGAKGKNKGYTSDALSGVKKKIIEKQSADGVDAVSEATCSSKAIIAAAKAAIADAKTTEEIVTVDKSSLQSAISAAQEKKEEDYTAASWAAFAKALADAKKVVSDDSAVQSTVDSAAEALKKAESGLVKKADKEALKSALDSAKSLNEEDYTEDSWKALQDAVKRGEEILAKEDAAQADADAAAEGIKNAKAALAAKPVTDYSALEKEVNDAQALKEEDYTKDSWKTLQDAVKKGQEILARKEASQADTDAAAEDIKNAKAGLAAKPAADYSALEKAVSDAEALKEEDYTEDSWKKMQEALSSAKALLAAAAASQEEADAKAAALEDAVKALVPAGEEKEPVYVLMNIPYDKFYAAEGVSGVDAVTTATVKTYNQTMAAGSYHEGYTTSDASGARILGVTYPVLVEDPSALEGLTQVTDESSAAITVAAGKSSLTTKDVSGKDLLFASGSYAYYVLKDAPNRYKVMNGKGSGASFGPVTGGRSSGSAEYSLTYGGHYTEIDFQVSADGLSDATVNAVVLTAGGQKYALTHVKNVWRKTDLGWNYDMMDLGGKTITSVTYYINRDGAYDVIDYPCSVAVKSQGPAIMAQFTGLDSMHITNLPEDIENPKATVKTIVGRGQTPVVIAENVPVDKESGDFKTSEEAVYGTDYGVTVVSDNYADLSAQAACSAAYVLMNIPYDKFYEAEGVSGVDAVTTATVKTYNQTMAAGSYHEGYTTEDASGAKILGVTYPVLVTDTAVLEGLSQVTDESAATITVAAGKSSLTTKEVTGKDVLFASGSYAYYVLPETPNRYKEMTALSGSFSFGPVTGDHSSGSAEYSLTYGGHYTEIDFQVSADGLSDATVNAVVLTAGGEKYALTHVKNVWRKTELGWNYDMMDLSGKTITNVTYYVMRDGAYDVIDYPCDVTVKKQGNEIQAAFDTSFLMTVTGLPEDIEDPKATVTTVVGRGQTPVVIAEDVPVNKDGTLETSDFAVKDTSYRVTVVSGNYADMSAQAVYEGTYVLMNIPYDKFYAAELNNSVPVDAFTSATKNKPRTAGLAGGSYHVDASGDAITGVIYPVYFEADAFLKDQNRVKDDTTVDISVTNRGQTSTTTMTGADALFEAPSYSWYLLKEAPAVYKSAQADAGTVSFGKTSAEASAAAGSASLTTKSGYGDYQIGVESDTVSGLDKVSAVVLRTREGSSYGLRHMENIWRKTELAFCTGFTTNVHGCQTSSAHYEALMGQTITEIDYYTTDAVYAISTDLYVPIKVDTELTVEDAAAADGTTAMNLSKALPDDFDALYAAEGLDAEAEGFSLTFNKDAKPGRYTLTLTNASGKYAPISADFTLTSAELPAEYNQGPEDHGLQAKEDADAEDFANYLKNITSVTVNGQTFNAAGRGAVVLIDPATGLIDLNGGEGRIFTGDEDALTLTLKSTGYPDYEFTLAAPVIIQGMDGEWTKESGLDLSFTSNAGYAHLRSVLVDGEELGEDAFISEEGSTVIGLKSAYLETLSAGSHTIGVKSANGAAQTSFTVLEKKADDSSDSKDTKKDTDTKKTTDTKKNSGSKKTTEKKSARTGDENSAGLWMVLLAAAAAGLVLYRRRRA